MLSDNRTYFYDSMNRVVEITDALNNTEYMTYSLDDKVASVTDRNNKYHKLFLRHHGKT